MASASEQVQKALREHPMAASELYEHLDRLGVSKTAASSAASRLVKAGRLRRARLKLRHGDSILYLDGDLPSPDLLRRVMETLSAGRSGVANVVDCLCRSHSWVTQVDIAKMAPLRVGHSDNLDFSKATEMAVGLSELGVISRGRGIGGQETWLRQDSILQRAGLLAQKSRKYSIGHQAAWRRLYLAITRQTAEWLWKNGFTSMKGTVQAGGPRLAASYSGQPFDILGFSHLSALRHGPNVPRAVVGDVLPGPCAIGYARGLVERVTAAGAASKKPPFAFVLAEVFSPQAHSLLKAQNIAAWTHMQFFNEGVAAAIQRALDVIQDFATASAMDPQAFEEALEGARHYGEVFGHLKGAMFELLVGHLLRALGYQHVTLAWQLGGGFDVDVLARRENVAAIVECKGYRSDRAVPYDEVKKHVQRRVPAARAALLEQKSPPRPERFLALVVASSSIESVSAAGTPIPRTRADTKVEVWDRGKLVAKLEEAGLTPLRRIIERYYTAPA